MRTILLLLCLLVSTPLALAAPDPAQAWLRSNAPQAYLVRPGETEGKVIRRFVTDAAHWHKVWCPWPGYVPTPPIRSGDLLVQVVINDRTWIQRVRRAAGPRPHEVLLRAFDIGHLQPFTFLPHDAEEPLILDPATWRVELPLFSLTGEVLTVLPATQRHPMLARISAGHALLLAPGVALDILGENGQPVRAVVAHVTGEISYVVPLAQATAPAIGAPIRGPAAWCAQPAEAPPPG